MNDEPTGEEIVDFIHERLRWMAFLAGWTAGRPDNRVDPAEVDRHYQTWVRSVGGNRGGK